MISVLYVWNRLLDYGAKYQSGTDTVAYFNTKLTEVQSEIFNDTSPYFDINDKIRVLLNSWVREQFGLTPSNGADTIGADPEIVNRLLSVGVTDVSQNVLFSAPETTESELIAIARMPQRAPNFASKKVYYRFNDPDQLQLYPKQAINYFTYYLIYPLNAHIAFTYTSTDDEDIMTFDPTNSVDLAWPDSAENLIIYKMLEKMGVSVREQLLQSYAAFGFSQSSGGGVTKN